MAFEELQFERRDNIGIIRLDRAEKKNAISPKMSAELIDVLDIVERERDIAGLLFTGVEDSFCSGLDLELFFLGPLGQQDFTLFKEHIELTLTWLKKLYELYKPTVAAVNGHSYGGGVMPVSLCDVAIASDRARFALSEINFAHFPAGGSTWVVSNFLLPKHYEYLCLSGDRIDAEEAFRMGLVTKVVPHDELEERAWEMIAKLAGKHPNAYRTAKKMCRMTRGMPLWDAMEMEMAHVYENYSVTDGEMVKIALRQFKDKKIKTGAGESYRRE